MSTFSIAFASKTGSLFQPLHQMTWFFAADEEGLEGTSSGEESSSEEEVSSAAELPERKFFLILFITAIKVLRFSSFGFLDND